MLTGDIAKIEAPVSLGIGAFNNARRLNGGLLARSYMGIAENTVFAG